MQIDYEIDHDGPYLRVVLPEVLPPDWEAVRRAVRFECEEPVTHAMIVALHPRCDAEADELRRLGCMLTHQGAVVTFQWRDEQPVGHLETTAH